ncbi:MAG: phosphatase PAP2 family protein [Bdellovibrionaceae bacterium]|nr:phosphatase PAP2 family protein [Pseudobdellovibrionaceae bacterium]
MSFTKLRILMSSMIRWPDKKTFKSYAVASVQLSVVFVVLYGFSNSLAAQRTDTYQLWMNWELAIPLVPSMIAVYLSLNLLTLLPLFTLESNQIQALGKGLVISTFIAAFFFLVFPAHAGFTRTTDVGFWAPVFEILFSLDHTANTFPSLHITYSFLTVRAISTVHSRMNTFLHLWFVLIVFSVLLIHQHHVIDIVGGIFLAELCCRRYFLQQKITKAPLENAAPDTELSQSPPANSEDSARS